MCKCWILLTFISTFDTFFFIYSTGDELTPGAKYDFKFKDYAPWVFRALRERFGIDPADYLVNDFPHFHIDYVDY